MHRDRKLVKRWRKARLTRKIAAKVSDESRSSHKSKHRLGREISFSTVQREETAVTKLCCRPYISVGVSFYVKHSSIKGCRYVPPIERWNIGAGVKTRDGDKMKPYRTQRPCLSSYVIRPFLAPRFLLALPKVTFQSRNRPRWR